MWHCQIKLIC
jgi:transposase-like protein